MKAGVLRLFLGLFVGRSAIAQTLAPFPTESVGCVPHDDHWYDKAQLSFPFPIGSSFMLTALLSRDCEGPRISSAPPDSTGTAPPPAITSHAGTGGGDHDNDHGHDDDAGNGSLEPRPTESVGCEPHGDHWHCDGPAGGAISTTNGSNGAAKTSSAVTAGAAGAVKSGKAGMLGAGVMVMVALVAQAF